MATSCRVSTSVCSTSRASRAVVATPRVETRGRRTLVTRAAQEAYQNEELLGAFFYGRAFAITMSKRLGAAVVDAVSNTGTFIAGRESRIKSFKEEVEALARQEMLASTGQAPASVTGSGSSGASQAQSAISGSRDPQANVDELRATIAEVRALLQQIKSAPAPDAK